MRAVGYVLTLILLCVSMYFAEIEKQLEPAYGFLMIAFAIQAILGITDDLQSKKS